LYWREKEINLFAKYVLDCASSSVYRLLEMERKDRGRPRKTWLQDTMNEDLKEMILDWSGKVQSLLPEIVQNGGRLSPSVPAGTGGTKSNCLSELVFEFSS